MPGWLTKISLLLLSALLLSLSLAPAGQFYLAWIGLVPWLFILSQTRTKKSAFLWSWIGGTIFFAANMWWIWKVNVAGLFGLVIYLGVFWGFAGWILVGCGLIPRIGRSTQFNPAIGAIFIAIVWTALEWLRGNWSMFGNQGLPWLYLGVTQSPFLLMCQIADFGGVYAVSFWVVLMNVLAFWLVFWIVRERKQIATLAPTIVTIGAITIAISIYGLLRMRGEPKRAGPVVLVIQPNYPQSNTGEKGASEDEILKFHLETTKAALADCAKRGIDVDLVAWSETMMPPLNPEVRQMVRDRTTIARTFDALTSFALENRVALIVGGMYVNEWNDAGIPTDRRNSAYLIESSGMLSPTRYDKIHLVPFGEFIPYDSISLVHNFLMKLGPSGYEDYVLTPGDGKVIPIFEMRDEGHNWRFATPICFEDIVGPLVAEMARGADRTKRVDFIVNLTNDGWFMANEMSQHLQAAIFRSIENRVPTARTVNTGISGFIDSVGRVHDIVPAGTDGWNVAKLSLDDRVTFYTQHGDLFVDACAVISGLLVLAVIFSARRKSETSKGNSK